MQRPPPSPNPKSTSKPIYQCRYSDCLRTFQRKTSLTNHLKAHLNVRSRSIYRTKRARAKAAREAAEKAKAAQVAAQVAAQAISAVTTPSPSADVVLGNSNTSPLSDSSPPQLIPITTDQLANELPVTFFNENIGSPRSAPPNLQGTDTNLQHLHFQSPVSLSTPADPGALLYHGDRIDLSPWTTSNREAKAEEAFSSTLLTNMPENSGSNTDPHTSEPMPNSVDDLNALMDPSNQGAMGCTGVVNPNMPHPSTIHSVMFDCHGFTNPNEPLPKSIHSIAEGPTPSGQTDMSTNVVGPTEILPHTSALDHFDYFLPQL